MSEELKPCPICGEAMNLAIMNNRWAPGKLYYVQCLSGMCINGKSIAHESVETAVSAWNALPRALVWTATPPAVPGFYWWREGAERYIYMAEVLLDPDGELRILAIDGYLCPLHRHGQWAGPIPTPQEPEP